MVTDFITSVEDIWAIWLLTGAMLSALVYFSLRSQHWSTITTFVKDEDGASYALAYLMTFPFYLILVCCVIQSTMILVVKIGVTQAAHTAARSAVVWRPASVVSDADGLQLAKNKSQHAAAVAMVPYASGLKSHANVFMLDPFYWNMSTWGNATRESFIYEQLFKEFARHTDASDAIPDSAFIRRKYVYAAMMTKVELVRHTNRFNESLKVKVRFRMPIHIPGTGRILGSMHWNGQGYYRDIEATAALPLETPDTRSQSDRGIGIGYDSSLL